MQGDHLQSAITKATQLPAFMTLIVCAIACLLIACYAAFVRWALFILTHGEKLTAIWALKQFKVLYV